MVESNPHPKWIEWFRSIAFAGVITFGGFIAIELGRSGNNQNFWIVALGCSLVLLIELLIGRTLRILPDRQQVLVYHEHYSFFEEISLHFLMPLVLYISTLVFGVVTPYVEFYQAATLANLVIFSILFFNLRAYFIGYVDRELHSHFVYDIIKFFNFFYLAHTAANIFLPQGNFALFTLFVVVIGISLLLWTGFRFQQLEYRYLIYSGLGSGLLGLALLIFLTTTPTVLQVSAVSLIGFYLVAATVSHLMYRTLTREIIAEYLIVLTAAMTVIVFTK